MGYFSFEVIIIKKGKIIGVKRDSIAEEIGIKNGDVLISINQEPLYDILDYKYNEADSIVELEIEHEDGEIEIFEIEKDESEELGIIFENELIDTPRSCYNKCIFCFMEQLPKDVRETLIFKDDDYRLSFFSGNYITLTNMKDFDIDRIIKYRLSPINISIHATDEDVRCKMLNNRHAGKVLKYLDRLVEAGITINTQIVLCKDINDGKILDKTIKDLSKYAPVLKSICIVPVGLSNQREGLYPLKEITAEDSKKIINQVRPYQERFKEKYNSPLVFLADEFYLKANEEFPKYETYGDFGQIEDGIGMTPLFEYEFNQILKSLEQDNKKEKTLTIIVGKIIEDYMREKVNTINKLYPNIKINIVAPINNYFGEKITVTGLLTGTDILNTLIQKQNEGVNLGDYIVISKVMLKEDEDIFLDDMKLETLNVKTDKNIVVTDGTASTFIDAIINNDGKNSIYKYDTLNRMNSYENSIKNK